MSFGIKNKGLEIKLGGGIVLLYLCWALGWIIYSYFMKGNLTAPYNPVPNLKTELVAPFNSNYILGTDVYGRSLLEMLSAGLLYSFGIALLVSLISGFIGLVIGQLSAGDKNIIKIPSDMLTNLIFVFPSILIAILFMSIVGQSFWGLVFVLSFTGWPAYAKIVRTEVLRVKNLSYVECSIASGITSMGLFFKIIIPAVLPVLLVHLFLSMSGVIIAEATLGFLGLGGSEFSFGAGLSSAKTVLLEAPHITILFSLALAGLIMGLNLLGDGLRDFMDPRNKIRAQK
ncbi:MAG: ABC transporter permease [Deltaproteobacteria bacterium]|nr:MAG: ABC transporter permease [Deltaproteobacteria bacterium]